VTNVTADHMNSVLGSVLKLINNNIDAPEAPWMKRIAGKKCFVRIIIRLTSFFVIKFIHKRLFLIHQQVY
jgi:hypothetical protein